MMLNNKKPRIFFETESALELMKSFYENDHRMMVIRNSNGVVIYENSLHCKFFGKSLFGLKKEEVIYQHPDYIKCIHDDLELLKSSEYYSIKNETFNNRNYLSIRKKTDFEGHYYIMTSIHEIDKGSLYQRDYLTNCLMRDSIPKLEKTRRYNEKVVAYVDLNGFKKINDVYGHKAGDECLKEFSAIFHQNIKKTMIDDILIRFGGDEFVILFNASDMISVDKKMKKLNSIVRNHFFNKGIYLSFSHGISKVKNNNISEAIDKADFEMYNAKRKINGQSLPNEKI